MNVLSRCLLFRHGGNLAARDGSATALDLISFNVPNAARLLDDLLDGFMTSSGLEKREDSPHYEIDLCYKALLADSHRSERQLGVIETFLKCKNERLRKALFLHPLIESFLVYKWKQLALFYRLLAIVYSVHLSSLTGYALCTHVYQEDWCRQYHSWILWYMVLIFAAPLLVLVS